MRFPLAHFGMSTSVIVRVSRVSTSPSYLEDTILQQTFWSCSSCSFSTPSSKIFLEPLMWESCCRHISWDVWGSCYRCTSWVVWGSCCSCTSWGWAPMTSCSLYFTCCDFLQRFHMLQNETSLTRTGRDTFRAGPEHRLQKRNFR